MYRTQPSGLKKALIDQIRQLSNVAVITVAATAFGCTAKHRGPNAPGDGERWISSVAVDGNKELSDSSILEGLVSHKPTGVFVRRRIRYDLALIDTDRRRIETYYRQHGFFDASVIGVQSNKKEGLQTAVTFVVDEGKRSRVSNVELTGVPEAERARVMRLVNIREGDRFEYSRYDQAKSTIVDALRSRGYAHARLEATALVDPAKHSVVLRYHVDAGPPVRIGKVTVRGLQIIPESAVRNRIAFDPGDEFSVDDIAQSRAQLRTLGRFGVVRIDFSDDKRQAVSDITVTVSEGPRRELRLGGGAAFDGGVSLDNSQWLVRARAGYTRRGVLDPLTTFDAELRPGVAIETSDGGEQSFVGEAEVSLTREDLWAPRLQGQVALGYDIRASDAYTSRGPGFRIGTRRPLWRQRIKLGINWRIDLLCFSGRPNVLDPAAPEYDEALAERLGVDRSCARFDFPTISSYKLAYFEETVALDLRDSLLDTRRGIYLEARFEQAAEVTGSEFTYATVTPEARGYLPIGPRLVLAARLRYGRTLAGTLPITRRYFSGGASSQRGFGQRQLAPVAGDIESSQIEIGGGELLESTLEARLDILPLWGSMIGLAFFTDAGDVADDSNAIDLSNLHIATGIGLRYRTPIGPFRLDVGYRATRRGAGEIHANDSYAWHLSIGEAF